MRRQAEGEVHNQHEGERNAHGRNKKTQRTADECRHEATTQVGIFVLTKQSERAYAEHVAGQDEENCDCSAAAGEETAYEGQCREVLFAMIAETRVETSDAVPPRDVMGHIDKKCG